MRAPEQDHATIAALSASLAMRPDAERVRSLLGEAFVEHVGCLWPSGRDQGSPAWIVANVDTILATIERLYAMAIEGEPPVRICREMALAPADGPSTVIGTALAALAA
jgi:hypothetical protein